MGGTGDAVVGAADGVNDAIVEMTLRQPVAVTDTRRIRASVGRRIEAEGLDGPPVELVNFNVLVFCVAGRGEHMVDFVDHRVKAGTAIWIRPGQLQQWSARHGAFDANVAVFAPSIIPDLPLFQQLGGATLVTELGDDTERTLDLIRWIRSDLEAGSDFATAAAAMSVVLRIFARNADVDRSASTPRGKLVNDFVESIEQNLGERSVTWHAKNTGASTRSVARATAEVLSLRPKEVIDGHVVLEARRRLAWSNDDVATISRGLRFSEPSNFTKFFRAHTGQSPQAFRQSIAAAESLAEPRQR